MVSPGSVVHVYVAYSPPTANHGAASARATARSRRAVAAAPPPARRSHRAAIQASAASPGSSMGMASIRCPGMDRALGPAAPRLNLISPGRYPGVSGPPYTSVLHSAIPATQAVAAPSHQATVRPSQRRAPADSPRQPSAP